MDYYKQAIKEILERKNKKQRPKGMVRWKWHEKLKKEEELVRKKDAEGIIKYPIFSEETKKISKRKSTKSFILTKDNVKDFVWLMLIIGFMIIVSLLYFFMPPDRGYW